MLKPELHLPDLPELALGGVADGEPVAEPVDTRQWPRAPWPVRLRSVVSAYLPILLMLALALATWWLVQNTPKPVAAVERGAPRHEPDYEMQGFVGQRYDNAGRLILRVEGQRLRHFPDTDEVEIDTINLHAWAPDGRETIATARRGIASGDSSEFRLMGGAQVVSEVGHPEEMTVRGEFLQVFRADRRVYSNQPVTIEQGTSVMRAQGVDYHHDTRIAQLAGRVSGRFAPTLVRPASAAASATASAPAR